MQSYIPSQKTLERYADVMVNFALNSGKGIKRGDVVRLTTWESAKPLYAAVYKTIINAGGHVLPNYLPDDTKEYGLSRSFYENAKPAQLKWTPEAHIRGVVEQIDHEIIILAEADKHSLEGVDPKKIMKRGEALKLYSEERAKKENEGKFTWTLALYGTEASANEAGLTLEEYWQQIIRACYLNKKDPIQEWKNAYKEIEQIRKKLNKLPIDKLHVEGEGTNLWIKMGERRQWVGGSGRNIPSFELFTSPDWRGTEGVVTFDLPLYRYGTLVKDVELEFKDGKVVKARASKGQDMLQAMVKTANADKIGEFSLTDKRYSKINKFVAETLFDENHGGKYGNMHLALGKSYHDTYAGDVVVMTQQDWEEMGYNDSSVHTGIVQTTDRVVTAHLKDGTEMAIYKKGQFQI